MKFQEKKCLKVQLQNTIQLTEEDLRPLKDENWEQVNRFLKEAFDWRDNTPNPKANCPLK